MIATLENNVPTESWRMVKVKSVDKKGIVRLEGGGELPSKVKEVRLIESVRKVRSRLGA